MHIYSQKILLPAICGAENSQQLVVWQKNGQKVFYDLPDEPRTTFEDLDAASYVCYPVVRTLGPSTRKKARP